MDIGAALRGVSGRGVVASVLLAAPAATAAAQTVAIDLPAGSVGQQVTMLGRQARVSIAVADPALWARRVPALRGRLTARRALDAIAARAGARVTRVGAAGFALQSAPKPPPQTRLRAPRPPVPAPAPADDSGGADIVVTASKRDVTRDHFAGGVSQVPGSVLERGGAGGSDRLVGRLTSVTSTYLGAGRNKLFIRGIADSSFTGPTQATVGQYYGDLRLSYNAPDPDLRLSDLAAVEVLEGPQGTLYGAGSIGGVIRLVPNPVDTVRASGAIVVGASATTSGDPGNDVQATVNLPVVEGRLALRVVANTSVEGGYIDKPLLGRRDVNRTRIAGGRATAHLAIAPDWSAELIGIGQRIRGADSQYADRDGAPLTRLAPVTEGFRSDYGQGQFVLSGRLGDVQLRSSSGATAHDLLERYDATPAGGPPRLFTQANRTRMIANETRAWTTRPDGTGWLAGVSYVHNRTRLTRQLGRPDELARATGVVNTVDEWTGYGEGSARPLPALLATAGLRVTRTRLDGRAADVSPLVAAAGEEETVSRSQTIVLPAASLLVDAWPDTQLYLRYQQGFRPGGLAVEGDFVRRFRADRVATVEAGVRRTGRLADVAITIARADWRDIQADFVDGTGLPSTANIGNGRVWTVEGVLAGRPVAGLRVEAAVAFNDGRVGEPSGALIALARATAPVPDRLPPRREALERLQGIPNIARVTARAGAVYGGRLGAADLTLDGWVRYVGSSRLGVGPVLGQRQGDYVDTELVARLAFDGVAVTLGATNLLDTRGNRFALGTPFATGRDQVTPLRPRTFRIGLDTRF